MQCKPLTLHRRRWLPRLRLPAIAAGLALACGAVSAQTVYRIVGPDGRVTFSDQPPPASAPAKAVATPGGRATNAASTGPALPYALQQVATRFPVTLYSGADCSPCVSARNLLASRGVPFTERTVATSEDIDALQRLSGDNTLPFGTIGGQQLKGFSDLEWTQFLDAAGYPKTSQLPANYRSPAATPLVAARSAQAPAAAAAANPAPATAAQAPAPAPAPAAPGNPAGITF